MNGLDPRHFAQRLAAASRPGVVTVVDLARVEFAFMSEAQAAYLALRREAPQSAHDLLLFLEHDPVYTISRRTNPAHLLYTAKQRAERNISVAEVDRGGDITFHGPGQVVAYPLLDLTPLKLGSSSYMKRLEQLVIDTLAKQGLAAHVKPGMPGVWVPQADGVAAKICAIGTRVSRNLAKHGLALNHTVELDYFQGIVPCGLPRPVTSLKALHGDDTVSRKTLLDQLATSFAEALAVTLEWRPAPPLG